MNKKINKIIFSMFMFIVIIELLNHSSDIKEAIYQSSKLWFYNLVPVILPLYLIIDICLNYNLLDYFCFFINFLMKKLFKMNKNTSSIFLLSLLSGFPSNSKYLKSSLDNNYISLDEAKKLLVFTHFSNPLFIIESIGIGFLHNKKIGIIILISHYLGNIILGLFTRNNLSNNNLLNNNYNHKKNSFVTTLSNSIFNTFQILILLYGIITFFMIITTLIKINFSLNPLINSIICGLLEITNGINYISKLSIPLIFKGSMITFFLSFGGLCIHMQVFSILKDYSFSYKNYFLIRLVHGIISTSIFYIIFYFVTTK